MGKGSDRLTNNCHIVILVFWEIGMYRQILNVLAI